MSFDFSAGAGAQSAFDLIPNGQLAWAIIEYRGLKSSQSGGQYLDLILTLDDNQPFARRKVFERIGDPAFAGNSDAYKQMAFAAIARVLEAGAGAGPNKPDAYKIPTRLDGAPDYSVLNGMRVGVKIKVEKGTGGYDDKNTVAEYLTPNPTSGGNKGWVKLLAGQYGAAAPAQTAAGGFGTGGAPQTAGGLFGGVNPAAAQAQPGAGFGNPVAQGQSANPFGANTGSPQVATAASPSTANSATTTSPSNGQSEWLKQANGG